MFRAILLLFSLLLISCQEEQSVATSPHSTSPSNFREVSASEFSELIATSTKPIVLDIYGERCHACRRLTPLLEEKSVVYTDQILFLKIASRHTNEEHSALTHNGTPTLKFFEEGEEVYSFAGVPTPDSLDKALSELANPVLKK